VEIGKFYFLTDQYFVDFPDKDLQTNKEVVKGGKEHGRPCFYAIQDTDGIYWVIPISSQTDKYQRHYNDKVDRFGECITIHFGFVLGNRRAFLIQNMCPVSAEYIADVYLDKDTNVPVAITDNLAKELDRKASLIFPNVNGIEAALIAKLSPTKAAAAKSD